MKSFHLPLLHDPARWLGRTAWIMLALALGVASAGAASAKAVFDLPAGDAAAALKRFSAQSGRQILYSNDEVAGIMTHAVIGEFPAEEALERLLAGTGLVASTVQQNAAFAVGRAASDSAAGMGAVFGHVADKATHAFLAGAQLTVVGTGRTVTVGHDGRFELRDVPAGAQALSVSYVGYETETFPVVVMAGRAARVDLKLKGEVFRMSAFTVEGVREGQARAINQQRAATNIKNIIAADAIGNFPDVNAAEALKRLPGVSTVRQRGEDRDITIRGAAPNLNAITIDGVSVLSNQVDGRTVSMDVYPAEQLAGVEITKSATPDLDGDSIGGVINLRSKSAFDTPRRVVAANAYWQYNDLAEQSSYRAGVNFSDVFGAQQEWGVQFSASRAQRRALEETSEPAGWAVRSGAAAGAAYAGYSPNNIAFTYVDIKRERTGGNVTLERKLGDSGRLYLRGAYNQFIERNARPRYVVQNAGTIAATAPVTVEDQRNVLFTSTTVRGQRVVNPRQFTDTGANVAVGGRTQLERWKLELVGAFARGTNRQDSVTGQWQTATNTIATFDLRDAERPIITRTSGTDLNDAALYAFNQLQIQDRKLRNREFSLKGDASRELALAGHPLKFSTGFKLRWSPKRWDQENAQYNTLTSGTLAMSDVRLGGAYEVKPGFLDGLMNFGPTMAPYGFYDFAKSNLSLFVPNAGTTLQNTLSADYYVSEGIYAGYAMGEWTRGPFTALAGLRYERTKTEAKAYRQNTALATNNPARYQWVRNDTDYTDVLPGVHLRYAPTKKLVFRASWNNTLSRPQTNRIAPSLNVTTPATPSASDPVIVSGGNPSLKATDSDNVDLSAEYYLKSIGLVSAGFFHKNLDGPIYRRTFDGTYEGAPARFTVFDNAGKARVSGWELTYQQQLAFLPGALDGLGVFANFTVVDSDVTLTEPGRVGEKVPLFNQSKQLGNLAVTYQKSGLFVRVSHNWRGDYLQALGNAAGLDQFARGFQSYDLLASYKLSKRWTLRLEGTNLTAAPEEQYVGTSARNLYFGDTGRSYSFGLTWNY